MTSVKNKYLKVGVRIELLTLDKRKEILEILKEHNQKVDSKTEILDPPKDLPYFAQYGKLHTWGAISSDVLFTSVKIVEPIAFINEITIGLN